MAVIGPVHVASALNFPPGDHMKLRRLGQFWRRKKEESSHPECGVETDPQGMGSGNYDLSLEDAGPNDAHIHAHTHPHPGVSSGPPPYGKVGTVPRNDAATALNALAATWKDAAAAVTLGREEKDLAIEFLRQMQSRAELIGEKVPAEDWVKPQYRAFCRSLGVKRPPPYRDFAHELGKLMPKVIVDTTRRGKRDVYTADVVEDPNAAVVQFADVVAMHQRGG
jgi:hypothetical protein